MGSSLLDNTMRGLLAEYIVARALNVESRVRTEWDAFDLVTPTGITVEVKSSAYIQSWRQDRLSTLSFGIAPTHAWDQQLGKFTGEKRRRAHVYVFCILKHKDQATIAPLDLDQWEFLVISAAKLNERVPTQKTIGIRPLLALEPRVVPFGAIEGAVLAEIGKAGSA